MGSTDIQYFDVRIIGATNQNLQELIRQGKFREDLFYRLNVISMEIPPLRQRRSDIPLLIQHFFKKYALKNDKKIQGLSEQTESLLLSYDFPGNVRELENAIQCAVTLAESPTI